MPRDVDPAQRLADIADATVRVARAAGAQAVTIRSVARELGGSTTLVTNYLPSRSALIKNVLDRGRDRWREERDAAIAAAAPADRLGAMLEWSLTSTSDDPVLRTLILEVVANATVEPELRAALHQESAEFQEAIAAAARDAGYTEPGRVAQLVYLLIRGAAIASTEDPDHWDETTALDVILDAVAALPRRALHHSDTPA